MPLRNRPSFTMEAFHFFLENAGYATPPGRVACAANLARAEKWARDHGIEFQWDSDDIMLEDVLPETHKCQKGFLNSQSCDHEVLFVAVDTVTNGQLYSLGGILDPTSIDRRLYEAELALEVMYDLQLSGRKLTEELLTMQYKHERVDDVADVLVREMGLQYAKKSAPTDVGQVFLAHQPYDGGYQLRQVIGIGQSRPLLTEQYVEEDMMIALCGFALLAVVETKKHVVDNLMEAARRLTHTTPDQAR